MTLHWPQICVLVFLAVSLGMHLADHGKPKEGKEKFWAALFSASLFLFLLWKGGFFTGGVQ